MNQGLKHYALIRPDYPNATFLNIEYWVKLSEIISMTKIASSHVSFVHYEKLYIAALGYLHKVCIMAEYTKKEHNLVDLDKVTSPTHLPTITQKSLSLLQLEKKR